MTALYDVCNVMPDTLSDAEFANCIDIIAAGNAVDPNSVRVELRQATVLALAKANGQVIGVGAIKRQRPDYAAGRAQLSGFGFDPLTLELGYVAVDAKHQGNKLSHRLVESLLSKHQGALFATTDGAAMKSTLTKAGFSQRGGEWKGKRALLSLWMRA